jgi:hypothetical protein
MVGVSKPKGVAKSQFNLQLLVFSAQLKIMKSPKGVA